MKKYEEKYNDFPKLYDKILSYGSGDGVIEIFYGDFHRVKCNGKGSGSGVGDRGTRPDYSGWSGFYNGQGGKV